MQADSRSRSQLKVMGFTIEFCVWSISPLSLNGFSSTVGQTLISVRWCAEPVTQLCGLKVEVTVKGHGIFP